MTVKYDETTLRAFAEMAVSSNPENWAIVSATLPDEIVEKVSAAVLVIESEKAATVIEKFLVPASERGDEFGSDLSAFIVGANDLAENARKVLALRSTQGRGEEMVRKATFPTRFGALSITLK